MFKVGDRIIIDVVGKKVFGTVTKMFPNSPSVRAAKGDDGLDYVFRPGNHKITMAPPEPKFKVGEKVYFKEPRKVRSRYLEGVIVSISGNYVTISGQNHAFTIRRMDTIFKTLAEAKKAK